MWSDEMVVLLRHVIDDLDDPPKYTDDRLMQLILVAAQFVQNENQFDVLYTVSIERLTLSPDPTNDIAGTRNDDFTNLIILKAACLLASSGLLKTSKENLSVKEGPYQFDGRGKLIGRTTVTQTWCKMYTDAQDEHAMYHREPGRVITGPYRIFPDGYGNRGRGECRRGGLF